MNIDPEELRRHLKKVVITAAFFALAVVFYALNWSGALVAYVLVVGVVAVLAILLQAGRGGGLAASLGGLGGDSLLGTHSATPIARATYVMLALFIFICILRARMVAPGGTMPGLLPVQERPGIELPAGTELPDLGGEGAGSWPVPAPEPSGQDAPTPAAEAPADD